MTSNNMKVSPEVGEAVVGLSGRHVPLKVIIFVTSAFLGPGSFYQVSSRVHCD